MKPRKSKAPAKAASQHLPLLLDAELNRLLFPLHVATEVEALWHAVEALLRAAFSPCARVTLFLGHFGMRSARLVFTSPSIPDMSEWYKARGQGNPFGAYARSHRGVTHYRFAQVVGVPAVFRKTEFYRKFAIVEGWDRGMTGVLWNGDEVKAMFSVYRKSPQRDFTDEEALCLEALRPHIGTAIDRIEKLHGERLHRKALEEFNRFVPVGIVLLDWDLGLVFANHEACRECAVWNHGPEAARSFNGRDAFELPASVQEACESIRRTILRTNAKDRPDIPAGLKRLTHPSRPGLHASVSILNASPGLLAKPGFMVVLENRGNAEDPNAGTAARKLVWSLTPSEREVALLIAKGLSNEEIATQLRKSVLTIKKQITSIFQKTGTPTRARLMARLR